MSIVVYRMNDLREIYHEEFTDSQLSEALEAVRNARAMGFSHVVMSTELAGQVGTKDRGGAVVDGKLPDGTKYEWSKAHRAGAKPPK